MRKLLYILLLLSAAFSSCRKSAVCDCFKSTGDEKTEIRLTAPFHYIELHNKVNVHYHYSTDYRLEVTAGKHLISNVTTEVSDGKLIINNKNKCNWVRDFSNEFEVQLYAPYVDTIEVFESAGNIIFDDTLNVDRFSFQSWSSTGDYTLKLNASTAYIALQTGPAALTVSGKSAVTYLWNQGQGLFNAGGLRSDDIYATNRGRNKMYMHADKRLYAIIEFTGNIYYSGNATDLDLQDYGAGEYVHLP